MTPEETAKAIVEEFNGHTFFMESMAQEWLAKRIAEGIRKHVDAMMPEPRYYDDQKHIDEPAGPEGHPDALKEAVKKVSALVKKPKKAPARG